MYMRHVDCTAGVCSLCRNCAPAQRVYVRVSVDSNYQVGYFCVGNNHQGWIREQRKSCQLPVISLALD